MKILFLILFCPFLFINAQTNLVPNPSFESYTACPISTAGEVNKSLGWDTCRSSPDYFNVCATTSAVQIPRNYFGCQKPASGNAYCGFWTYASGGLYREIIVGQLTNSLTISQKYYISFKVSRADSIFVTGYSNNKLGAKLSTKKQAYVPINNSAHYYSNSVITDTIGWTKLFGSFVADSTYQYIMIGNFFDDFNTTSINDFPGLGAYYYIDDVCLSSDSAFTYNYNTSIKENSKEKEVKIFPNPCDKFFTLLTDRINLIEIINNEGQRILINYKIKEGETKIDCSEWPSGIYLIKTIGLTYKLIVNH